MSALLQALPPEDANVVVVPMLTPSHAVDLFLGDLQRRSRSKSGRTTDSYRRLLDKFTDRLDRRRGQIDVSEITPDDCRGFLDEYNRKAAGYQATIYSTLNSFLEWLYQQQRIKRNPLDFVTRPRRVPSQDLDVTSVTTADVTKLLAACKSDSERIALAVLCYLGPRRHAVAMLRLSDYNRERGLIRFREKGSKVIWKPVPEELCEILEAAIARGVYTRPETLDAQAPFDPYLVPADGPLSRHGERDDRVIWRLVKAVGDRANIEVHVHALRAAFATYYLESGGDLLGLQEAMGHRSIETTRVYLRKLDKQRAMEPLRKLSWAAAAEQAEEFQPYRLVGSFREETLEVAK